VPGGFGNRGIEGKIDALTFLRQNNVPTLGICLGMQLAAIEFARNVLGLESANSQEFDEKAQHQIIHLMENQKDVSDLGGTMRLGAYPCDVKQSTHAYEAYGSHKISERHRHRFEFNNSYRSDFESAGVVFSGTSPDDRLVEMMELKDHPWYVAVQFHPELKSSPKSAHPLFRDLIANALKYRQEGRRIES